MSSRSQEQLSAGRYQPYRGELADISSNDEEPLSPPESPPDSDDDMDFPPPQTTADFGMFFQSFDLTTKDDLPSPIILIEVILQLYPTLLTCLYQHYSTID